MREMVECPHCGATFKQGRAACPECGSDERTGWLPPDEIDYQSLDIPDHYPGDDASVVDPALAARHWAWIALIVILLVIAFVLYG